ncbi:dihydrolipoamide acetyltransferase family protein [Mesorhizobium sp.]|uniref:dihydrolipoamide acetyltransferase family protein n=2 Tax=Mesorhizobium sp. TaxID=1871066 RepID=UPI000FE5A3B1|nr:dihydrolipoamide acetyltransferase family protein [Mesorhizobium sp.]RWD73612.1 MAG: 2-oxo acid dehydrogenase subunit E2 [Mesorhizobium sp.]RWE79107.1 MAG: 2-oxo acid dehydrogenase subunit E2 [Mesorhizobium sp.]
MGANVVMPQLGETVAEGRIVSWFKKVGDTVTAGERLFEVETDKVTIDVEAIEAGTITEIRVGDGATAPVGAVVAILGGASASEPLATPEAEKPIGDKAREVAKAAPSLIPFEEVRTSRGLFGKALQDGVRVTPLARRLIAEQGIDLKGLLADRRTKGVDRIAMKDVQAYAAARGATQPVLPHPAPAAPVPPVPVSLLVGPRDQVVAYSSVRQKTADRLAENWRTIPHVFQALEVDFTAIDTVRKLQKDAFKAEHGLSLTFLPFITKAISVVLREYPEINARTDGTRLIRCADINIGIAVDLSHKGLVVPVLHNADELTVPGIARRLGRLVEKARTGKLGADDMAGGTYSITNNGAFGTQFTAPIINAPQVAILSSDAIRLRPAVVSTSAGDFIAPRMLGMVGQSFDHRAFDGAYSAAFLSRLKSVLETRNWDQEFG